MIENLPESRNSRPKSCEFHKNSVISNGIIELEFLFGLFWGGPCPDMVGVLEINKARRGKFQLKTPIRKTIGKFEIRIFLYRNQNDL